MGLPTPKHITPHQHTLYSYSYSIVSYTIPYCIPLYTLILKSPLTGGVLAVFPLFFKVFY